MALWLVCRGLSGGCGGGLAGAHGTSRGATATAALSRCAWACVAQGSGQTLAKCLPLVPGRARTAWSTWQTAGRCGAVGGPAAAFGCAAWVRRGFYTGPRAQMSPLIARGAAAVDGRSSERSTGSEVGLAARTMCDTAKKPTISELNTQLQARVAARDGMGALSVLEQIIELWKPGDPQPDKALLCAALPRILVATDDTDRKPGRQWVPGRRSNQKARLGPQVCEHLIRLNRTFGYEPNIDTYNALITSYGGKGDVDEVWSCMERLEADGLIPDARTHSNVADVLLRANLDSGLNYVKEIKQAGHTILPEVTCTAIDAFSRAGRSREVVPFLNTLDLDLEINEYALWAARHQLLHTPDRDLTIELLHLTVNAGAAFKMHIWRDFAAIMGRAGSVEDIQKILNLMRDLHITTRSVPINLWWVIDRDMNWGNAISPKSVEVYFNRMMEAGLVADSSSYHILVKIYSKHWKKRDMNRAVMWYDRMIAAGFRSRYATFFALIDGFANSGQYDKAEEWFLKIEEAGLTLNKNCYKALITPLVGLGQGNQAPDIRRAEKWVRHAAERGLAPDAMVTIHRIMLESVCRARAPRFWLAKEHFNHISNLQSPTETDYRLVIRGAVRADKPKVARAWYRKMLKAGINPSQRTLAVLKGIPW